MAALDEVRAADRDLQQLADRLRTVVSALDVRPPTACFRPLEGEQLPPLSQLVSGAGWDAETFPTPDALQSALRRRLSSRQAAQKIYDGLSRSLQNGAPAIPR
jgi:hypothetical protein